jgi:hypothetical protein
VTRSGRTESASSETPNSKLDCRKLRTEARRLTGRTRETKGVVMRKLFKKHCNLGRSCEWKMTEWSGIIGGESCGCEGGIQFNSEIERTRTRQLNGAWTARANYPTRTG